MHSREASADPSIGAFELEEMNALSLQSALSAGQYSSELLVRLYHTRIQQIDKAGPKLNSIIELNPDAAEIASKLDAERKAGKVRGPLHGIPVVIKDNICTADRMQTTAGSLALVGAHPKRNAPLVDKLIEAGCIILAKTNLSEWANFRSTHSVSGWSGRGGQTHNPYVLDRSPSGSSSGSGAAAAASLATLAVGTETDGSILSPSAASGLVGIKPTLGLISRTGIIPLAHSQDTAGPMCRTVADAAALLSVMVCSDAADPATMSAGRKTYRDYTRSVRPDGLKGKRIGVARKSFTGYHAPTDKIFEEALRAMKDAGAILVDPADLPTAGQLDSDELTVLLYEFKEDLNNYLASLGPEASVHSLKEVIEFNEREKAREMPFFGQEHMLHAQKLGGLKTQAYVKALEKCRKLSRTEGIDAVMTHHNLDAMVAPTQGPAWLIDHVNGDSGSGGSSTSPAAVAGYPSITVPAGFCFGLPIGVSFWGKAWTEPVLIEIASGFEHVVQARKPPKFLASALKA